MQISRCSVIQKYRYFKNVRYTGKHPGPLIPAEFKRAVVLAGFKPMVRVTLVSPRLNEVCATTLFFLASASGGLSQP